MPRQFYPQLVETKASSDRPVLRHPERALRAKPSSFSHHLLALRRSVFFVAAAIVLVAPMAVAVRHAEAEITLARCWPLDLSVVGPRPISLPALRADSEVR
ncbi:MAG: hypothetical protein ACLPSF_09635 [Methylocella sp.]